MTKDGWKKITGTDVGQLHYEYYKTPEDHPTWGVDPLGPPGGCRIEVLEQE